MRANLPRDPVCGLEIHLEDVDSWVEYGGTQYFFCCPECRRAFEESPEEYAAREKRESGEKPGEESGRRHTGHQACI